VAEVMVWDLDVGVCVGVWSGASSASSAAAGGGGVCVAWVDWVGGVVLREEEWGGVDGVRSMIWASREMIRDWIAPG
jgi:hypothetical protein